MQPRILYQILTEPVLPPALQPEQVTESRWHQPLSEPVRRGGLITAVAAATSIIGPSLVPTPVSPPSVDGWHGQISQPTLRKREVKYPAFSFAYFTSAAAEVVTVDKYYKWLSEPVRRSGFPAYDQQALAFTPQPISGSGDVAFASINAIVPFQRTMLYPAVQGPVSLAIASGEVVTVDKYYNWLAEPVRLPRALVACLRPYLSFVQAAPFPESISADRWQQPLSEPVRGRGYKVFQQVEPSFVGSDTATDARWFVPLSDPSWRKPAIYPDAVSWVFAPTAAEIVTLDKWYAALREPTRLRLLPVSEQPSFAFVKAAPFAETVSIDRWMQQLSQPTLRLVSVAGQPFAAWSAFTPQPIVVLAREWIIKARRRGRR